MSHLNFPPFRDTELLQELPKIFLFRSSSFYKDCLFSCDLTVLYKCKAVSLEFILHQMPFLALLFQEQGGYQTDSGMSQSSKQFLFAPGQSKPTWEPCYRYKFSFGAPLPTPSCCWDAEGESKTVLHH